MKIVLVAAVALIDKDGRVLLSQRPMDKQLGGLWEFPGGKVEAGERPEAALMLWFWWSRSCAICWAIILMALQSGECSGVWV